MMKTDELKRPIWVVVFSGGPTLERGVRRFLTRLEEHPQIKLQAIICQSDRQDFAGIVRDLWRRRRFLALPLLLAQVAGAIGHYLSQPRAEVRLNRKLARLSDRIHFVTDIHDVEVLDRVRSVKPDLGLIYGSPILKPELFEIPVFGTLGIHHGKVPEYRGKKTAFWAMYNGEETAGVTIQKVNAGLDTGQIVNKGSVLIGGRSRRAVWDDLEQMGLDLYIRSILQVREGTASYSPQDGKKGKLYRDPSLRQVLALEWRQLVKRFR